jgi:hypothetical protein
VFYDKLFIAQKTLKSMPSTTPEVSQDRDDLDDSVYTPRSGAASPIVSPTMADRHLSIIPSTNENFNFEQSSTMPSSEASQFLIGILINNLRFL